MALSEIPNSSFLDLTGYQVTTATTVKEAYQLSDEQIKSITGNLPAKLRFAITLQRANDPQSLLDLPWGDRQKTIKKLNDSNTLWQIYGASQTDFDTAVGIIKNELGLTILDSSNSDLITSAESRTIWVELTTSREFEKLFGLQPFLFKSPSTANIPLPGWDGNIRVDERINLDGIWLDFGGAIQPPAEDFAPDTTYTPPEGPQSIGNSGVSEIITPYRLADKFYNFPLGQSPQLSLGQIGLLATNIGEYTANPELTLQQNVDEYLGKLGIINYPTITTIGAVESPNEIAIGERDLDVSVVAAINPTSNILLYPGGSSGNQLQPYNLSSIYTGLQSAAWDNSESGAAVLSSSYADTYFPSPNSPFNNAQKELYTDLALKGITCFVASGDKGSNTDSIFINNPLKEPITLANGLPNTSFINNTYAVSVGGTSLSIKSKAEQDPTLNSNKYVVSRNLVEAAKNGDREIIWQLIKGGLKSPWESLAADSLFIESVWNEYNLNNGTLDNFLDNAAGSGGVDPIQTTPQYQQDYGLDPRTAGITNMPGRGLPDVAALAGGNHSYLIFDSFNSQLGSSGGTSAAAPLWAALAIQINAIFNDQGLPNLGYINDLLYTAAAVAPASFQDVTYGNIRSSYANGGIITSSNGPITPKGFGYEAGDDYDLVTGLGSPNGVLLTQALTALAHRQLSDIDIPEFLQLNQDQTWISQSNQSLLFQPIARDSGQWQIRLGPDQVDNPSAIADAYGWTRRLAQQSLQADFSGELTTMFDGESLGAVYQQIVSEGAEISLTWNKQESIQPQASLTAQAGFVDFVNGDGSSTIQVALPVAIATTAQDAQNQDAIVRLRQVGGLDLSLRFYRVDDLTGVIDGIQPGDATYETLLRQRLYKTSNGSTTISGPGYGDYSEDRLVGINSGDLIAMSLSTSQGNTFNSFASANEKINGQHISHLRNFGLNTWGWEDLFGGGDQDFNDLIVGLDFTSASGSGAV